MAEQFNVLVTTRFFDPGTEDYLRDQGCRVERAGLGPNDADGHLSAMELSSILPNMDGWIVGAAKVTRAVLELSPRLQIIARRGVGYDLVDVAAAHELGKIVSIAPGGNEASVADHALGLMLSVGMRISRYHQGMARGDWTTTPGHELNGKTVGLLGFGRIARLVAQRLSGFGVRILACDPMVDGDKAKALGATLAPLETVLREADIVSLHLPATPETRGIIGAAQLALMKPGSILINTARGGLVVEGALLDALERGQLWGAGLDVFAEEGATSQVTLALANHPRAVTTPHISGSSHEALLRTNRIAAECVLARLRGQPLAPGCLVAR